MATDMRFFFFVEASPRFVSYLLHKSLSWRAARHKRSSVNAPTTRGPKRIGMAPSAANVSLSGSGTVERW